MTRVTDSPFGDVDAPAEALLVAFLDASSQGMMILHTDGAVASWNRGASRIFGHAADDVIGKPLSGCFARHVQADIAQLIEQTAAGEHVRRAPLEIERTDRMVIPVAVSLSPVVADGGAIVGCAAVVDELTESRLAQAVLAETEARSHEFEALAHVGRWLWDVGTDSMQWSDELHRMHGVDLLEFDGTRVMHLASIQPDDRDRIEALMDEAVASGRSFADVYHVVHRDGTMHRLDVRAEPSISSSGSVVGLRGVSRGHQTSAPIDAGWG